MIRKIKQFNWEQGNEAKMWLLSLRPLLDKWAIAIPIHVYIKYPKLIVFSHQIWQYEQWNGYKFFWIITQLTECVLLCVLKTNGTVSRKLPGKVREREREKEIYRDEVKQILWPMNSYMKARFRIIICNAWMKNSMRLRIRWPIFGMSFYCCFIHRITNVLFEWKSAHSRPQRQPKTNERKKTCNTLYYTPHRWRWTPKQLQYIQYIICICHMYYYAMSSTSIQSDV